LGGHTNTISVEDPHAGTLGVDTGFIVHNRENYPGFTSMLDELDVATQPSEMSLAVTDRARGFSYRATNPNTIFADRRNLVRGDMWKMLLGIRRFWRDAHRFMETSDDDVTLGDLLAAGNYPESFVEWHLRPMVAAIWSAAPTELERASALDTLHFLDNHGLLGLGGRPRWRTVVGGSRTYVDAIIDRFEGKVQTGWQVRAVIRTEDGVDIVTDVGRERYDCVVLACHSDQALRLIDRPTDDERSVLGSIGYQPNTAVLHTDQRRLPPMRRAWAAWNVDVDTVADDAERVRVTYDLTTLQRLPTEVHYLVSLNPREVDPDHVIATIDYAHPVLDQQARRAQRRLGTINGADRLYFCGAWAGHGFHEDGVSAAHDVCRLLGVPA
jgi:predicted NAD/FAD-binding protein